MKRYLIKIVLYIIIFILLIILFISLVNIIQWFKDNKKTKELLEEINSNTEIKVIDDNERGLINVDISDLRSINNDTVGYIKLNNTNVNYPVVQTVDNDFYLDHTFDKSYSKAGWVFMDYRNHNDVFDTNTIIYAHGRLDNTMFGSLRKVLNENWYLNSDNQIIQYSNEYYNTKWQIFSIYKIRETNDYLKTNFNNSIDNLEFVNLIKDRSIYNFNVSVDESDKILTLSSCYDDYYRMVIHAKLIKQQKKL